MPAGKKINSPNKYCPGATGTNFSNRFVLDAKWHNSAFWNISNLGFGRNLVNLKIHRIPRSLGRMRNENMFLKTTLDKILQKNSRNWVK